MSLRFVVAFELEARPLIAHYRLVRDPSAREFPIFVGDDVALAISGLGKVDAAAATTYLHFYLGGERNAAWINAGIAGHGSRALGSTVLAHKIRDRSSGRCWYPTQVFEPGLETDEVVTVDDVERHYRERVAYEMEASGFYPTACRFSTAELVQCVKVVSDGPESGVDALTQERVQELMQAQTERIVAVAERMLPLVREARKIEEDPPRFRETLERWHFTTTERHQLRRCLERWQLLCAERSWPQEELARLERGSEVLRYLRKILDSTS